jgi:FkbM family methyltransferase
VVAWDGFLLSPRDVFAHGDRFQWEAACRRLTFSAPLSGNDVLCRVLGRYTFVVDGADAGLAPHLIADGFWESWITRLVAERVAPGMTCVDAGANLGYYTVLMADLVGSTGTVFAAEPVPETRRLLSRNVHHNQCQPQTRILDFALGADHGAVTMVVPRGEPKNARVGDVSDGHIANGDYTRLKVRVAPIDSLEIPRLDFIKIDVEGAEQAVWNGMQQTMDRSPDLQIVMEMNSLRSAAPDAFLKSIQSRFPLRTFEHGGQPVPIDADEVLNSRQDVMLYLAR